MGHNGCDGSQASGPWVLGTASQVLETQQKRKRAPATHFDASPDSGKDQPKK